MIQDEHGSVTDTFMHLSGNPYLIFVTGITGGARVKNSVRCKIFQINGAKLFI